MTPWGRFRRNRQKSEGGRLWSQPSTDGKCEKAGSTRAAMSEAGDDEGGKFEEKYDAPLDRPSTPTADEAKRGGAEEDDAAGSKEGEILTS